MLTITRKTFSLHQWEAACLANPARKHLVSPVVAATLLDFDARILNSYLFVPPAYESDLAVPQSFMQTFHSESLLNTFLALIVTNLQQHRALPVLSSTVALLKVLCAQPRIAAHLLSCSSYLQLLTAFPQWSIS